MTRKMIINELNNRGFNAHAQELIRNSVKIEGIIIRDNSNVAPIIYTEAIIEKAEKENKSLYEVVSEIVEIYENSKNVDLGVNSFFNRDFILSHIFIGLQKESTEKIIKRSCGLDGIESYLFVRKKKSDDEYFSLKITERILLNFGISIDEAWNNAERNTNSETKIESMAKFLSDMMGFEYSEKLEKMIPFFILSNTCKMKGASAILNKKALEEFGEIYHTKKIVVFPSSIHEMMILPYKEDIEIDRFSDMVKEVNNTSVDETEKLTDRAYILSL